MNISKQDVIILGIIWVVIGLLLVLHDAYKYDKLVKQFSYHYVFLMIIESILFWPKILIERM